MTNTAQQDAGRPGQARRDPAGDMPVLGQVRDEVEKICSKYPNPRSATIPLLFLAQSVEGHVTHQGMRDVGTALGLTPAEVLAVASFYTMLKKTPQGEYLISVCRNISCTHRGGRRVLSAFEERLGISTGQTTSDGRFSLEAAECLATCDGAPAIQVNYEDFYNVTPDAARDLVDKLERGDDVKSVRGASVRTHKEIARETALAGTRLPHGEVEELPTVGGETPAAPPGFRPKVQGEDFVEGSEKDVEGTEPGMADQGTTRPERRADEPSADVNGDG